MIHALLGWCHGALPRCGERASGRAREPAARKKVYACTWPLPVLESKLGRRKEQTKVRVPAVLRNGCAGVSSGLGSPRNGVSAVYVTVCYSRGGDKIKAVAAQNGPRHPLWQAIERLYNPFYASGTEPVIAFKSTCLTH